MVKVQHLQLWIHKKWKIRHPGGQKQGLRARWDGPIRNSWLPIPYTSLIQVCLNGKSAQNLLNLQEVGGNCTKMFTVHHFETYIHTWILDRQKVISHPTLANPLRLRNRMPTLFLSEEKIWGLDVRWTSLKRYRCWTFFKKWGENLAACSDRTPKSQRSMGRFWLARAGINLIPEELNTKKVRVNHYVVTGCYWIPFGCYKNDEHRNLTQNL